MGRGSKIEEWREGKAEAIPLPGNKGDGCAGQSGVSVLVFKAEASSQPDRVDHQRQERENSGRHNR